jgi:hypothetical protein
VDTSETRISIVVDGILPTRQAFELHRLLGIGVAEVRDRVAAGRPLLDEAVFGNDHLTVSRVLLDSVDVLADTQFSIHECKDEDGPSTENEVDLATLRQILAPPVPESRPVRPVVNLPAAQVIAEATRASVSELREMHPEAFNVVGLADTGDPAPPYLMVSSAEGDARSSVDRWDLAASPYAVWGYDDHFMPVVELYEDEGLFAMDGDVMSEDARLDVAHVNHLATLEEALRILDIDGFFGRGADRESVLLTVEITPPDHLNASFARRLNPDGPLLDEWLAKVAELPLLEPDPEATTELGEASEPPASPPNITMARLWRMTPGLYLPDGTTIYGPHSIGERNETYEVAEYCPGWVLIGDDGGGNGYLMRATGNAFDPAQGRDAFDVYVVDHGALADGIAVVGEFVTDDLLGWLACRLSG